MSDYFIDVTKTGGLNDGSDWANAFLNLYALLQAVTLTNDDNTYFAHNHIMYNGTSTNLWNLKGTFTSCTQDVMPVEHQEGAIEYSEFSSNTDFVITFPLGITAFNGVSFVASDIISFNGTGGYLIINGGKIGSSNSGQNGYGTHLLGDGANIDLTDVDMYTGSINVFLAIASGTHVTMDNCTNSGVPVNSFVSALGNGGGSLKVNNTDMTQFIKTDGYLCTGMQLVANDSINLSLYKCKLPKLTSWTDATPIFNYVIDIKNCSNPDTPDDDSTYYYEYHDRVGGDVYCDTSNYLTTFDDGYSYSTLMSSSGIKVNSVNSLRYKIATIPASDLTTSLKYKINFTSDTALTDVDFWLDISYSDNTSPVLGITDDTRQADFLVAGTAHPTNSEPWEGGGTVKMHDEITIPALSNIDDGAVEIWANLHLANTNVWVDPFYVVTEA